MIVLEVKMKNNTTVKKQSLTIEEIAKDIEIKKNIRRKKLEQKIIKLTKKCYKEDIIYVFSSLINKIVK